MKLFTFFRSKKPVQPWYKPGDVVFSDNIELNQIAGGCFIVTSVDYKSGYWQPVYKVKTKKGLFIPSKVYQSMLRPPDYVGKKDDLKPSDFQQWDHMSRMIKQQPGAFGYDEKET